MTDSLAAGDGGDDGGDGDEDRDEDRDGAAAFVATRPKLFGVAYRMLGSVVEAEDVVGDVAERWTAADRSSVRVPEAWLVTATTRRALDVLRSARIRREQYTGVWLPEPVATGDDPGDALERPETLAMGFLLLLERLTPLERAVFVLHDVLDYGHRDIAAMLDRSEDSSRQALHRARRHVTAPEPRTEADRAEAHRIAEQFLVAGTSGDVDQLVACLAEDIVVTSDGGGVVYASMRPVTGRVRVARYLLNLGQRIADDIAVVPIELNGTPSFVLYGSGQWVALVVEAEGGLVHRIHAVVHPGKLQRLVASLPESSGRPGPWDSPGRFRHRRGGRVAEGDQAPPDQSVVR
ncbi:MAG: RNA polymerase sigma factor SigJ [Actinomycetota bacterium]|nr:RNA polymerase sigma factor SigJ [Actinomycetota bacterium]